MLVSPCPCNAPQNSGWPHTPFDSSYRLLFHRVRPVFVFDGGTPTLKRRTLIARRRRKEAAGVKLRKTAEKLLLAQLK